MKKVNFLLLSGSPRGNVSTSSILLEYLQTQLETLGKSTMLMVAHKLVRNTADYDEFMFQLAEADFFILAAPLYVDSLPSHILEIFTRISKERRSQNQAPKTKFVALVNNGFPEYHQNQLALDICHQFAHEAKLDWVGGIPIGGGPILGRSPLASSGFRGKHARLALEMLAQALSEDKAIPKECIDTINKIVIPKWMYLKMAHMGWRIRSGSNKVRGQLHAQPYLFPA